MSIVEFLAMTEYCGLIGKFSYKLYKALVTEQKIYIDLNP